MEHHFNTKIAEMFGIEEAILIHHFFFWIAKNAANDKHFHDGLYWTYNSKKAYATFFSYMNETKVARVIKHLETEGIVVKGNYNDDKWDRTNWYAITPKGIGILGKCGYSTEVILPSVQNDSIDSCKMNNASSQNDSMITDNNNTYSNKEEKENIDINISKEKDESECESDEMFIERMYKMYPSKCPIRGVSLGKSSKDKTRIRQLMKQYSREDIERVIGLEVKNKYGKISLRNFSTFLNNFPDPAEICENSTPQQGNLFGQQSLPLGMIITESAEERNKKYEESKGW